MEHMIYFPSYVPVPTNGSWIYVIAYAWEQSFHSAGVVKRVGRGDFNNETFVEYQSSKRQTYNNRPL